MNTSATLVVLCGLACTAHGQYAFTRVADTSTPAPSSTGRFLSFRAPAVNASCRVVFSADAVNRSGRRNEGVFSDASGALASHSVGFHNPTLVNDVLDYPDIDAASRIVFTESLPGVVGSFVRNGTTTICGAGSTYTPAKFANMGGPSRSSVSNGVMAYSARRLPGQSTTIDPGGLYTGTAGVITQLVADGITAMPNTTSVKFGSTSEPDIEGNKVTFLGWGRQGWNPSVTGVYQVPTVGRIVPTVIADNSMTVPGTTLKFSDFYAPSFDGTDVGFTAWYGGQFLDRVLCRTFGGVLTKIVDPTTSLVGMSGRLMLGREVSVSGVETLFTVTDARGSDGLFLHAPSTGFVRVIGTGDPLDGRTVRSVFITRDGLEGRVIGIRAVFTNGTEGVYITKVPAPGGALFAALAGVMMSRRRR